MSFRSWKEWTRFCSQLQWYSFGAAPWTSVQLLWIYTGVTESRIWPFSFIGHFDFVTKNARLGTLLLERLSLSLPMPSCHSCSQQKPLNWVSVDLKESCLAIKHSPWGALSSGTRSPPWPKITLVPWPSGQTSRCIYLCGLLWQVGFDTVGCGRRVCKSWVL